MLRRLSTRRIVRASTTGDRQGTDLATRELDVQRPRPGNQVSGHPTVSTAREQYMLDAVVETRPDGFSSTSEAVYHIFMTTRIWPLMSLGWLIGN